MTDTPFVRGIENPVLETCIPSLSLGSFKLRFHNIHQSLYPWRHPSSVQRTLVKRKWITYLLLACIIRLSVMECREYASSQIEG